MKTQILKLIGLPAILILLLVNQGVAANEIHLLMPKSNIAIETLEITIELSNNVALENNAEAITESSELDFSEIEINDVSNEDLIIEDWMTNDEIFRLKKAKNREHDQNEEAIKIEKWMTNNKLWIH